MKVSGSGDTGRAAPVKTVKTPPARQDAPAPRTEAPRSAPKQAKNQVDRKA